MFLLLSSLDLNKKPIERVLGMIWDLNDDTFVFRPIPYFYSHLTWYFKFGFTNV